MPLQGETYAKEEAPEMENVCTINATDVVEAFKDLTADLADTMETYDFTNIDVSISIGPLQISAAFYNFSSE